MLLGICLQDAEPTDAQTSTKPSVQEIVRFAEKDLSSFKESNSPIIQKLFRQALLNVDRYEDAIATFGTDKIHLKTLNRICLEMTRHGHQDAIEALYAAQKQSTSLTKEQFAKNLHPGLDADSCCVP